MDTKELKMFRVKLEVRLPDAIIAAENQKEAEIEFWKSYAEMRIKKLKSDAIDCYIGCTTQEIEIVDHFQERPSGLNPYERPVGCAISSDELLQEYCFEQFKCYHE